MPRYAIVVIAALLAGCSMQKAKNQPPATGASAASSPENAFADKILIINLKSDPDVTLAIEKPIVKRVGYRVFVVGVCVEDGEPEEWRAGLTVWTAMDDISQIVEVRDREELRRRMEEWPDDDKRPTRA